MEFAIISDIHGNLPALEAVIDDAGRNGVGCFIFVGDYCISNPYPGVVRQGRGEHKGETRPL